MIKGALFAVAGFLGLCISVSAQQTQRPEPPTPLSPSDNGAHASAAMAPPAGSDG